MRMRLIVSAVVLAILAFGFTVWKRSTEPATPEPSASQGGTLMPGAPDGSAPMAGSEVAPPADTDAGVVWTVPKIWLTQLTGGMRLATYIVPGADAKSDAECAVYYFGPGQGGGMDANLERWAGEFEKPERKNVGHRKAGGIKITTLEMRGTYSGHAMSQEQNTGPKTGWAMLGAIVEGPRGNVFFKLNGPAKTVAAATPAFNDMLGSFKVK